MSYISKYSKYRMAVKESSRPNRGIQFPGKWGAVMKLTRIDLTSMFDVSLLFKMHKAELFCCTRAAAEAEGISAVCAFVDSANRMVVLIEDDCDLLSKESIKVIMCHELAHVIIPSVSEEQADEFAARFTNPAAVRTARDETERVREQIRAMRGC